MALVHNTRFLLLRCLDEKQGTAGLKLGYKGKASYLRAEETEAVIAWLKSGDYWIFDQLRIHLDKEYSVTYKSRRSYYDLFKLAGISWKKTQKRNPKKDPARVVAKQAEIKKLMAWSTEVEQGKRVVFFLDEIKVTPNVKTTNQKK